MNRRRSALVALAALGALGGCGGHGRPAARPDLAAGRQVFVSAGCGRCHAVAAVHALGGIGPDFDTSERLDRAQIRTALDEGANGMPSYRHKLTPAQQRAVTEFVFHTLHRRR